MRPKISQQAFEAQISDSFSEERNELEIAQVSPAQDRDARSVHLPVAEAQLDEVAKLLAGFSRQVAHLFTLETGAQPSVRFEQAADRTYAGYANIYRALKALAPLVGDCRFFIKEMYSTFIDELRIEGGQLWFERGQAEDEFHDDAIDYFREEADRRPDDLALQTFVARLLCAEAEYDLSSAILGRAAERLDEALRRDPASPDVWLARARLARARGDVAAEADALRRSAELRPDVIAFLELTTTALRERNDADALVHVTALSNAQPTHALAAMLAGFLLREHDTARARAAYRVALAQPPAREDLHEALRRTGRAGEVLGAYLDFAEHEALSADERRAVSRDVLGWAKFFRIKAHHGVEPERSRALAVHLVRRATAMDPLDGDVAMEEALFHPEGDAQRARLVDEALALNPAHLGALYELGRDAHRSQKWASAVERWKRYLAACEDVLVGTSTHASSYSRDTAAHHLVDALCRRADELAAQHDCDGADRLADEALALQAKLGAHESWEGPWLAKSAIRTVRGAHAEALEWAELALLAKPGSGYALAAKAACLADLDRGDEALTLADEAIRIEPAWYHGHIAKARVLAKRGERAAAMASLRRAITLRAATRDEARRDPAFASLAEDPELLAILKSE